MELLQCTARGQWAVELLRYTAHCLGAVGSATPQALLPKPETDAPIKGIKVHGMP